ncbi:MAG: (Fe-S)-binding protein [bacterium]|nr:(Fe-S)-binding protein [bacterium]
MEFASWEQALLIFLVLASAALFVHTLRPRIAAIRAGKSDRVRTDQIGRRLWVAFKEVVFQTRVIGGRPVAGALHAAVFGGFMFFGLETTEHFLKPFGVHFIPPFYKVIVAVWAVLVSIGIVGLAFRRFAMPKISPDPKAYSSGVVALLILLLMVTFLYAQAEPPAGLAKANWWLHALIIVVFPHLIIRSKHFHIMMAPINIFFRTHRLADLKPLNLDIEELEAMEEEPTFGLETLGDLSWKQRMDFLTCVECKRCTDNCPANLSGQELDPRGFILAGRASILEVADDEPAIGNILSEKALGQCTTCGACEESCPVGIEHLQVLTGAKQAQALALGTGMVADDFLKAVERRGNPFEQPVSARAKLIEELGIPTYEAGKTEVLLWLGCVWSFNPDAKRSLESMVKILRAAGKSFGVLEQESCSGHHSRRQGEEMQYQTLAGENIERLKASGAKKMVAPCPHCLHTIGREYPDLDPELEIDVVHHSEYIQELLAEDAIQLDGGNGKRTATYHDPCYLGRYEKVYDAPRDVIRRAGLKVVEMDRHRERAVCCGGGGAGFMRQTEEEGLRVDQLRKGQVKDTGAKLLVTGCPECKMMLDAAVEETKDLAEVVADSLS